MPEADVSDVDLDRMSEEEVMDLIKAALERLTPARYGEVIETVETMRRTKQAEVKETFIAEMRERAMQMGLSFDALFGTRKGRSDAGQPLTPKYRGPHGETWSGRGRQPRWLAELEASGHDKEQFRIKEEIQQGGVANRALENPADMSGRCGRGLPAAGAARYCVLNMWRNGRRNGRFTAAVLNPCTLKLNTL